MCISDCLYIIFRSRAYKNAMLDLFRDMGHKNYEMKVLEERYIKELYKAELLHIKQSILHIACTTFVSTGLIVLIALLSLEKIINHDTGSPIFWITFALSLFITIINKLVGSFGLYRRYIDHEEFMKHFKLAGWEYICKLGRYKNTHGDDYAEKNFSKFCKKIETLQYGRLMTLTGDENLVAKKTNAENMYDSAPSTPKLDLNLRNRKISNSSFSRKAVRAETAQNLVIEEVVAPPNSPIGVVQKIE